MPGIDFNILRQRIAITQVLDLLTAVPRKRRGSQCRGPCPFRCCPSKRAFVAYLDTNRYCCFHCKSSGNAIELWATLHHCTIYEAALDLCHHLQLPIPYIER